MAKITWLRVRATAMVAGVSLAVAGGLAGGGPAAAGAQVTGHRGLRAALFAQILHHGSGPTPGEASLLNGVFCTSWANCWAVGDYAPATGTDLNQVLHWNGKTWSQTKVASPGGDVTGHLSELYAVRCTSASNCWAVGYYDKGGGDLNEALHWNGTRWSVVATPAPGGTLNGDVNELYDVVCPSPDNCWADGEYGSGEKNLNEILHWNGTTWSQVRTPNPAGTGRHDDQFVDAIRCSSARSCLAVGTYGDFGTFTARNLALRWNGTRWSLLPAPDPGGTSAEGDLNYLAGLGCVTASDCWAAGEIGSFPTGTILNEILHWNGTKWSVAAAPDPDGTGNGASNLLSAVSCLSAASCWAVGSYRDSGAILNQALHWTGAKWSVAPTADPEGTASIDGNELFGVRCTSVRRCWAVGDRLKNDSPNLNEELRWNGTSWLNG